RSINGAANPAGQTDDLANSISHCGDSVEGPLDSGSVVSRKAPNAARHVLDVVTGNQRISQIDGRAGIARLGLPAQVHNGFDQRIQLFRMRESFADMSRKDVEQEVQVVR